MTPRERASRRGGGAASLVHLGLLAAIPLAFLAGRLVRLPASDPWHVGGRLVSLDYSPTNNVLRLLFFLAAPPLLLLGARALLRFRLPSPTPATPPEGEAGDGRPQRFILPLVLAVALLGALNQPTPIASGPLDTFHEGESLGAAVSHLHGGVPYVDDLPFHGLWQDPLRAVVSFRLFGRSIGALRSFESIQKIVVHLLFALLVYRLFRGRPALALAVELLFAALFSLPKALFGTEGYLLYLPTRDIVTFAWILLIGGLLRPERRGVPRGLLLFLAGLLPALALAISVDRGIYLLAAAAIALPALLAVASSRRGLDGALVAAGLVAGLLATAILLGEGRREFVRFAFDELPRYKDLLDGLVFPIGKPRHLATLAAFAAATHFATLALLRRVDAAGGSWRPGIRRLVEERPFELLVLLLGVFLFRNALNRGDGNHLAYSSALGLLAALRFVVLEAEERGLLSGAFAAARRGSIAVAAFAIVAGLGGLLATPVLANSFPLRTPDRDFLPPGWEAALAAIRAELRPGERFYALSSEGCWYHYLDLPSPTRFVVPWWAVLPRFQEELVRDLERRNVALVLVRNGNWSCRIDGVETLDRLPLVRDWLERSFVPWKTIGGNEIRIRKGRGGEPVS